MQCRIWNLNWDLYLVEWQRWGFPWCWLSLGTGKVMYHSHMGQGICAVWFAWHVHHVGYSHRWLKLLIMVVCLVINYCSLANGICEYDIV
jgi:hypothetical protein